MGDSGVTREGASSLTVLIIDDEKDLRELYACQLAHMGFRHILQARNGKEGVKVYAEMKGCIDLILLDLNMPVMDGAEFFRKISGSRRAKVLLMTASSDASTISQLQDEGLERALKKPAESWLVKQVVAELLGLR